MSDGIFTDRAASFLEAVAPFIRLAMVAFIAYALAAHLGWIDATAIAFAFVLAVRALRGTT